MREPQLLLPKKGIEALVLPSYIKLDMAFGLGKGTTLFDKSRYRAHGTISGASWATGAHGYALDFNEATPSYVSIAGTNTSMNFTTGRFTIIMRVKFDALDAYNRLLAKGTVVVDGYYFMSAGNGRLFFRTSQSGAYQESISAVGGVKTNTWYTLGVSRQAASCRIYINGVQSILTEGTHVNPASTTSPLLLGIAPDLVSRPLNGKMEFCRILGGIYLPASGHLAYHNALA